MSGKFTLIDFFEDFITLSDRVLPNLKPAEQSIYSQFFARTIAIGQQTIKLSYRDIMKLTGLSQATITRALKGLDQKKALKINAPPIVDDKRKIQHGSSYDILWPPPPSLLSSNSLVREPKAVLKDLGSVGSAYDGILNKLTDKDMALLEITAKNLSNEKILEYKHMAELNTKQGEDPEKKFLEHVLQGEFGRERLEEMTRAANQRKSTETTNG